MIGGWGEGWGSGKEKRKREAEEEQVDAKSAAGLRSHFGSSLYTAAGWEGGRGGAMTGSWRRSPDGDVYRRLARNIHHKSENKVSKFGPFGGSFWGRLPGPMWKPVWSQIGATLEPC